LVAPANIPTYMVGGTFIPRAVAAMPLRERAKRGCERERESLINRQIDKERERKRETKREREKERDRERVKE
jgi:hypothetical protein